MATPCRDEADELSGGHGHSHESGGDAGAGGHGHSHGAGESCAPDDPDGNSLLPFIDVGNITCLNESVENAGQLVFKALADKHDDGDCVVSDADAELIIHVPFTVAVKLKSFCIIGGANGEAPSKVKLFTNREDVDFDLAGDLAPQQEMELAEDFEGAIDYGVKAAKFQNISSLTMFIPENHGADETRITYIGLKGEGTTARRGVVECTYEARAQLKDHAAIDANVLEQSEQS